MITPGQVLRLLAIQRVLIRHGLDEIILATHLFRPLRFLLYLMPWNWVRRSYAPQAQRIRNVLEDLGPVFVKFGQQLSTRRDLLPDVVADELSKLQDSVPPFPGAVARRIVESAYGHPLEQVFAEFDEQPLASASIAQVHAARLLDGRKVIVKVVRPGIYKTIRRDLGLMYILAGMAERYWSDGRRLQPTGVVAEFERIILDELDLMREAANASQLRRNFAGAPHIYVPEVDWNLTRTNVMVMERISAIPISDVAALRAAGIDLKELAEKGVEIFFTQVFRDHFFHADMHPGNLFVAPPDGKHPWRYIPVDFGIMGSLSDVDQRYLAENFMAFMGRDYRRVATLHVESGWVPADTRVDEFEFAIRTVCEPMFERPLKQISFGRLLIRLFQTAQRFHMKILPQLLLLQKTLVNVEGLGRQLYPDLDLWRTAQPSLERWMKDRMGLRSAVRAARSNLPIWSERLPELPGMVFDVLDKAKSGGLQVRSTWKDMPELREELRRANRRTVLAVIGSAFIVGAAALLGLDGYFPRMLGHAPLGTWVLGAAGLLLIVGALGER